MPRRAVLFLGFQFPPPEAFSLSYQPHLVVAQAFIPPTERVEVAGFEFPGDNFALRDEVIRRTNAVPEYRERLAIISIRIGRRGTTRRRRSRPTCAGRSDRSSRRSSGSIRFCGCPSS